MKEDDMDAMMRKAAANYDVDASRAADWNAVYSAVHETKVPEAEKKKRKRYPLFWWLLVIPAALLMYSGYNKFIADGNKHNNVKTSSKLSANANNSTQQALPPVSINSNNTEKIKTENQSSNADGTTGRLVKPLSFKLPVENSGSSISKKNNTAAATTFQPLINNNKQIQPLNSTTANTNNNETGEQQQSNNLAINQQTNAPAAKNADTITMQNATVKSASSSTIKLHTTKNYLYGGLVAGTDLSFIKHQRIQSLGYNAGILVGYKFNKLSIETGIMYDKKNYYTKGEYFDKSSIAYFNDASLLTVNGYCRMYEIPLNIKYNFSEKKKHSWFASAGFSSYLMNKEFYNYDYIKNGQERQGSYPYYHTTKNWFSVLNVSAGYEFKTSVKTNLRIEPYYKTSLSGVGTGNLSISSTGINVGIIRHIP